MDDDSLRPVVVKCNLPRIGNIHSLRSQLHYHRESFNGKSHMYSTKYRHVMCIKELLSDSGLYRDITIVLTVDKYKQIKDIPHDEIVYLYCYLKHK